MTPVSSQKKGRFLFSFRDLYHDKQGTKIRKFNRQMLLSVLAVLVGFPLLMDLLGLGPVFASFFHHLVFVTVIFLLFSFVALVFQLDAPRRLLGGLSMLMSREVRVYTEGIELLHPEDPRAKQLDRFLPFSELGEMKETEGHWLCFRTAGENQGRYTLRNPEYSGKVLELYWRRQKRLRLPS